jgi:hypothetical protein
MQRVESKGYFPRLNSIHINLFVVFISNLAVKSSGNLNMQAKNNDRRAKEGSEEYHVQLLKRVVNRSARATQRDQVLREVWIFSFASLEGVHIQHRVETANNLIYHWELVERLEDPVQGVSWRPADPSPMTGRMK